MSLLFRLRVGFDRQTGLFGVVPYLGDGRIELADPQAITEQGIGHGASAP
jgi:hypothetical protein